MAFMLIILLILAINANAYNIETTQLPFTTAEAYCRSTNNANLATITTDSQLDDATTGTTTNQYFWIGGNRESTTSNWYWEGVTTAQTFLTGTSTKWASGQPQSNANYDCAAVYNNQFYSRNCDGPNQFICNDPGIPTATCTQNEILYENAGPITPSATSPPITTIPMHNNMIFKFNILINSECTGSNWCSVFHIGDDTTWDGQHLQRYPAIYISPFSYSNSWTISFSTVSDGNPVFMTNTVPVTIGTQFTIEIKVTQFTFTVIINDIVVKYNDKYDFHHTINDGLNPLDVNIGQKGTYDAGYYIAVADASITNLKITKICKPYILNTETYIWNMAQAYCRSLNSNLASFTSSEEFGMALSLNNFDTSGNIYWMGYNDIKTANNWVNVDGTECYYTVDGSDCKTDRNWLQNKPTTTVNQDCAYVQKGQLRNGDCQIRRAFYCNSESSGDVLSSRYSYMLVEMSYIWNVAQAYCRSKSSDLASITTLDELATILKLNQWDVNNKQYWFGMNDIKNEATWVNEDGTLCDYTLDGSSCLKDINWREGQPAYQNDAKYDCTYLQNGMYYATNCQVTNNFICNDE
eukprot:343135_1